MRVTVRHAQRGQSAERLSGRMRTGTAPVWARVSFTGGGCLSSGLITPQHIFAPVGLSDSGIYGWIDSGPVNFALSIGQLIDSGHLSDVYPITPTVPILQSHDFPPLVIKIMSPETFNDADNEARSRSRVEADEAWERETGLFAGKLSGLQSTTVPQCFGALQGLLYLSDEFYPANFHFMLLEKLGDAVCRFDN
ncbi:hypothetical protein IAR50_007359 [Cryptococcus sp. DSM 104548]